MPKVSIIVPIFNAEKYIEKCLNTLVNQTLQDIEIICVNDGSTDHSMDPVKKLAAEDTRIKIIEQAHQKQGAARNNGMKIASGEYLGFVDADDWVDVDFFEKLYNAAQAYKVDIALANNIRVDEDGKGQKKRLNIEKEEVFTTLQGKFDACHQWRNQCPTNKIYRRTLFIEHHLTWPEGMYCEDKFLSTQVVYYANGLVTVPGVNYYYYRNPTSTVNLKTKEHVIQRTKDNNKAKRDILNFLKEKKAEVRDNFWATKVDKRLFNLPLYRVEESLHSEVHLLFGLIPIFWRRR